MAKVKCELYNDSMQGWKCYPIQKAQLIIADVPYNVGNNFYGSNPMWYNGGENKNGESKLAGKAAFASDYNFNLYEYFHFCSRLMKKDDKKPSGRGRSTDSPCMIVFCSFEQQHTLIDAAKKQGFANCIPLVFIKHYSPQVLKANMRVVGATEYALLFYRDRLPKFRNGLKVDENGKTILKFQVTYDNANEDKYQPYDFTDVSTRQQLIDISTKTPAEIAEIRKKNENQAKIYPYVTKNEKYYYIVIVYINS